MATIQRNSAPLAINRIGGYRGDVPPHKLPPGASPSLRNVLIGRGQATSYPGFRTLNADNTATGALIHLSLWQAAPYVTWDPIVGVWGPYVSGGFQPGSVEIYDPINDAWYDITPSDYAVTLWSDDLLFLAPPSTTISPDQQLILANTAGIWRWNPTEADDPFNPGVMEALPGLTAAGIESAFTVASFGPHTILGAVQMDGEWYGNRFYWSDTNNSERWQIGTFEEDGAEVTSVAGFADMPFNESQQSVVIIRMEPLRDYLLIYTKETVRSAEFVGSPFVWVFRPLQTGFGLRSWDSIVNMGDRHIIAGWDGDIYEFNGVERQSIGAPIRDTLNRAVKTADGGYVRGFRAFLKDDSAVFYFSTNVDAPLQPDTAIIWNVREREWSIVDFPFMCALSVPTEAVDGNVRTRDGYRSIDSLTGTIDDLPTTYGDGTYVGIDQLSARPVVRNQDQVSVNQVVMGGRTQIGDPPLPNGVLYKLDGWTQDGDDMTCRWRSHVMSAMGPDGQGDPRRVLHWCNALIDALQESLMWLEQEGLQGDGMGGSSPTSYTITWNLYSSDNPNVDWDALSASETGTITIGASPEADPWVKLRTNARYAQFEITATSGSNTDERPWTLQSLILYAIPKGLR